jgi:hypothetical protein
MTNWKRSARGTSTLLTAGLFAWSLAWAGACSSDEDDNPSPNTGGTGARGGSQSGGAKNSGGTSSVGGSSGDTGSGVGGSGASGGSATAGGEGGSGNVENAGAESGGNTGGAGEGGTGGRVKACPATDLEFLNRPNTSQCAAFANTRARLPGLNPDGSLPPLPGS